MITANDLLTLLPSSKVLITDCQAAEHGDNVGCLCNLKGTIQTIDKRYENVLVGTPTWHLKNLNKRIRLAEVTLVREDSP